MVTITISHSKHWWLTIIKQLHPLVTTGSWPSNSGSSSADFRAQETQHVTFIDLGGMGNKTDKTDVNRLSQASPSDL